MSKTEEKTLLSQNWAHKMFYVILPAYFKELQKYQNLQFLVKTSPKITFYIVREYYIITIYIFTMEIYHNMQYEINGWLLHRFMRTPLLQKHNKNHPTLADFFGVSKCCFLVEIYSLTIQLQFLGLKIIN